MVLFSFIMHDHDSQVRSRNLQQHSSISHAEKFWFWLGGADADIATQCSRPEQSRIKNLGRVTLVPALLGFFSAGFFGYDQTHSPVYALLAAVLWGFMILIIDVAILSLYSPRDNPIAKMLKVMVRLAMAVGIGVMISHPLMLLSFRDAIKDRWASVQEVEVRRLKALRAMALETQEGERQKKINGSAAELTDIDKRIADVKASKAAKLDAARRDKVQGSSVQLQSLEAEMKANVDERAKLTAERAVVLDDVNKNMTFLNQEMQFGLNSKDDAPLDISDPEVRKSPEALKRKRAPGNRFTHSQIMGGPDGNPPSQAPRIKGFIQTIEQGKARNAVIDQNLMTLATRQEELQGRLDGLRDQIGMAEKDAVDAAVSSVNAQIENEVAALKALRAPIEAKQAAFMAAGGKADEDSNVEAYDLRLQDLSTKLKALRDGQQVIDSMVQTQMLFQHVFNPKSAGESLDDVPSLLPQSMGSKFMNTAIGIFEIARYFIIFMILDLVPIVMKITKGVGEYDLLAAGMVNQQRPGGFGPPPGAKHHF